MSDTSRTDGHLNFQSTSWISGIAFKDLQRLRKIVRRIHFRHMPGQPFDVREADKIIESFGQRVAEKMLKAAVDTKVVE